MILRCVRLTCSAGWSRIVGCTRIYVESYVENDQDPPMTPLQVSAVSAVQCYQLVAS